MSQNSSSESKKNIKNLLSELIPDLVQQTNCSEISLQCEASGSFSFQLKRLPSFEAPPVLEDNLVTSTQGSLSLKYGPHSLTYERNHAHVSSRNNLLATIPAEPSLVEMTTLETSESDLCAIATKIIAPLVGILYVAKSPQEPPFCKVGDIVKKGQTLFIIDSMKVMNPVTAPISGKIIKISAKNELPVEFGEILAFLA